MRGTRMAGMAGPGGTRDPAPRAFRGGVAAALLWLAATGAAGAAPPPPGPDAAEAQAEYGLVAAPLHYAGVLQGGQAARPDIWGVAPGVPAGPEPQRLLRLGLYPADPQGRVRGSALLLDAQGAVLAGGPVEGMQHGDACRLRLSLGAEVEVLHGSCGVAQLSGTLTRRDRPTGFNLVRFLLQQGGGRSDGEAWLGAE